MPSPLLSTFFYPTSHISSTFFHQNSILQNASSQKSAIYRPTFVQDSFKVRPSYLYNSKFFFLKILIPISLKNYLCGSLFRVSPRAPNQTLLHFLIFSFPNSCYDLSQNIFLHYLLSITNYFVLLHFLTQQHQFSTTKK